MSFSAMSISRRQKCSQQTHMVLKTDMTHHPETGAINRLHFLVPVFGDRKPAPENGVDLWHRFLARVSLILV